jgi:hypothetical protein
MTKWALETMVPIELAEDEELYAQLMTMRSEAGHRQAVEQGYTLHGEPRITRRPFVIVPYPTGEEHSVVDAQFHPDLPVAGYRVVMEWDAATP